MSKKIYLSQNLFWKSNLRSLGNSKRERHKQIFPEKKQNDQSPEILQKHCKKITSRAESRERKCSLIISEPKTLPKNQIKK